MYQQVLRSHSFVIFFALLCSFAVGCGGKEGYQVSGKVTFMGKSVPAGKIYFMPDSTKGNSQPAGYANIKDGHYDTSAEGGRGAPSGAVRISLEGIDPSSPAEKSDPSGEATVKLLFSGYEVAADLPQEDSTKDFDVPAEAAKGPVQPKASNVVVP